MPLTQYAITGSLRDALDTGPAPFGTVTFTPIGSHDSRIEDSNVLLGSLPPVSIVDLPATYMLDEGLWRVRIDPGGHKIPGSGGRLLFDPITVEFDHDGPTTWAEIVAGAVTPIPLSPTIPEQVDSQLDSLLPSKVSNPSDPVGAALSATYATILTPIAGETATATTTRINAALAAGSAFGARKRIALVGDFTHNGPLVVQSKTELDTTQATLTLASNSNTNGIVNAAVLNTRRVMDAVTTAASTTLTSATAAFVSGDVGKTVTIWNPATTGGKHTTTIASVTNGTTAVLTVAAPTTGAAQYASIGSRDSNIIVRLGKVIRSASNYVAPTNGWLSNHLRFRHVDNLHIAEIHDINVVSGKYAVNVGDCSGVRVGRIYASATNSDVLHLNGPCSNVTVDEVTSEGSNDDIVSLTAGDFTTIHQMADCQGDITDVRINRINAGKASGAGTRALLILAGRNSTQSINYTVARISCEYISSQLASYPVWVGGDTQDNNTQGGSYQDITICPGGGVNVHATPAAAFVRFRDQTTTRAFVGPVRNGGSYDVEITAGATVTDLTLSGVKRSRLNRASTAVLSGQLRILGDAAYGAIQSTKGTTPVFTVDRRIVLTNSVTLTSGTVMFGYFRVNESCSVSSVTTRTRGTAAATPTLCKVGIYEANNPSADDLTLLIATTNDTSMWAGTFASYGRPFAGSASVTLDPSKVYAFAALFVGTTAPAVLGLQFDGSEAKQDDRIATSLTGQTDLPATVSAASLGTTEGKAIFGRLS